MAIVYGCYFFGVAGINLFFGLGGYVYVGAGALVMGGSAFFEASALQTPNMKIWVQVPFNHYHRLHLFVI